MGNVPSNKADDRTPEELVSLEEVGRIDVVAKIRPSATKAVNEKALQDNRGGGNKIDPFELDVV